ncbi:UNVERIFIED_CONTAM: cupredoxin domain-containing protein [Kocuria sp. CPCC 205316]|uniref:cupredoxin domain-containing protein n=1 Tax=Kocuria TaxID=57493 RepID=UPI0036D8059E
MNLRQTILSLTVVAAAAGLTGCGAESGPSGSTPETPASSAASTAPSSAQAAPASSAPTATTAAPAAAEEVVITIKDFQYELPDSVAPGATVTVINEDAAPHTVTAENAGGFNAIAAGGETVTFTAPEEPGEYPIICTYHPQMSATLVVQ